MDENKKSSKKSIIIILAVIIIALLVGGFIFLQSSQKPRNVFIKAIDSVIGNTSIEKDAKTINSTVSLSVNANLKDETYKNYVDYINKTKLTANLQMDYEQEKGLLKLTADYDNDKILDGKISYKNGEDIIYGYVEEIFDKYFALGLNTDTKEFLSSIFKESKDALKNTANIEKGSKIAKETVKKYLKDEYFSKEKAEIEIDGEKINATKNILAFTPEQFKTFSTSVASDLRNNQEFINCFNEEDREKVKKELEEFENDMKDPDQTANEKDSVKFNIYTTGFNGKAVKYEAIMNSNNVETTVSASKLKDDSYDIVVNESNSEIAKANINITEVDKNKKNITIKVSNDDFGEATINLEVSIVFNEKIEDVDTSNNVKVEELTQEQMTKIQQNLYSSKLGKLIATIMGAQNISE